MAKRPDKKKLGSQLEMLPVKLSDSETLDRAKKASAVNDELKQHLLEATSFRQKLKAKEEGLNEQFEKYMHAVATGAEPREVEVEAWADFAKEQFYEVRTDTGQVINKRALRPEERQDEFDLPGWQQELHLRVVRSQEEIARRRAGEKPEDDGPEAA